MPTNLIASLIVSTALLAISASTVIALPEVISNQNTAQVLTIDWN